MINPQARLWKAQLALIRTRRHQTRKDFSRLILRDLGNLASRGLQVPLNLRSNTPTTMNNRSILSLLRKVKMVDVGVNLMRIQVRVQHKVEVTIDGRRIIRNDGIPTLLRWSRKLWRCGSVLELMILMGELHYYSHRILVGTIFIGLVASICGDFRMFWIVVSVRRLSLNMVLY